MVKKIFITLVLVFVSCLRVYRLSELPAGFFTDEASIGYNAYTILTQGKDEHRVSYPIFFNAFGEYKSPVQIYSTIPFVKLFGLNEFSLRLTSVIFGTLSIFAIYFLTKELLKDYKQNKTIALFAALFLAISPWHIHLSRIGFELMPFVFFTTIGLYLFLNALKNLSLLPVSVTAFVLAIYSYFPARIFIPLVGFGIFCIYYRFFWHHKKETVINFVLALLLLAPFIQHSISSTGLSRWQQVSVFSHPPKDETILQHIFNNYISHFSLDFLFLKGDIDMTGQITTRHSVRGIGELYLLQSPLIVLGFIYLIIKRQNRILVITILWLILYPIGSMFTVDKSAQATRSIIGVIPFQIISAVGLYYMLSLISKVKKPLRYLSIFSLFVIIFVSFVYYLNLYFVKYPQYSSDFWGWQYGPRDIMKYFLSVKDNYDDLYMSGEFNAGHIFLSFYDPLNTCQSKCKIGDFFREPQIYNPSKKQLFSLSPDYLSKSKFDKDFLVKKTIRYPNGTIAFQIGEIVK